MKENNNEQINKLAREMKTELALLQLKRNVITVDEYIKSLDKLEGKTKEILDLTV